MKIPRGDTDGVGEDEVTVTSEPHTQKDQERRQRIENRERHPGGGAKIRSQVKWLKHVGARRGTAGWLCRKPESKGWWLERTLGRCRQGDTAGGEIPHECARTWRQPQEGKHDAYPVLRSRPDLEASMTIRPSNLPNVPCHLQSHRQIV